MRFGITANVAIPAGPKLAREAFDALKGQDLILENEIAKVMGQKGQRIEDMDVDMMIAVGGDGTILRALQKNKAPVLGINAGDLGFLTEIPIHGVKEGIERILQGKYILDERTRLKTTIDGKRMQDATNEAVVHTAHIAKIRHFKVFVDDELAIEVRADGIIIATPTGSTCYAMSVGAPMLDPRIEGLIIAPMAPFKFAGRPTVVPAKSDIRIELVHPKPCVLVCDGQEENPLQGDEKIDFTVSDEKARFVSFGRSFYTRARMKLMDGTC